MMIFMRSLPPKNIFYVKKQMQPNKLIKQFLENAVVDVKRTRKFKQTRKRSSPESGTYCACRGHNEMSHFLERCFSPQSLMTEKGKNEPPRVVVVIMHMH